MLTTAEGGRCWSCDATLNGPGLCSEVYPDGQVSAHSDSTCVRQFLWEMIARYTASSKAEALGGAFPLLDSSSAFPLPGLMRHPASAIFGEPLCVGGAAKTCSTSHRLMLSYHLLQSLRLPRSIRSAKQSEGRAQHSHNWQASVVVRHWLILGTVSSVPTRSLARILGGVLLGNAQRS